MSILDMDVTARRDPAYIRSREFARVRKGYDPDQVRDFLHQVAGWFDDMETDLATARAEHVIHRARDFEQPPPADPFAALGERVAEVLRTAEEHADRSRAEAEEAAQRLVDEAREEARRLRDRAQEESEAVRQSAQEQAEATRRSAQDEADRVREEAAHALETARVEAERMVAGLAERRNALSAELHATKTRLMGIVSGLEEDSGRPEHDPFAVRIGGSVAAGDPRRDSVPPDIPAFVPPSPPRVTFPQRESGVEPSPGAESTAVEDEPAGSEPSPGQRSVTEASGDADAEGPAGAESGAAGVESSAEGSQGSTDPGVTQDASDVEADREPAPGDATSWLWTPEEETEEREEAAPLDLSFPDFGAIDLPSLEDDDEHSSQ